MSETSSPTVQADLNLNQIAALAREMAMAIKPVDKVLSALQITPDQFKCLQEHPTYRRVYEAAVVEWESATSTTKRLAVQAAAALEEFLPDLAQRLGDNKEDLNKLVAAAKFMANLAGIGENTTPLGGAERFRIVINLGADRVELNEAPRTVEIEAKPVEVPAVLAPPQDTRPDLSGFPEVPAKVQKI